MRRFPRVPVFLAVALLGAVAITPAQGPDPSYPAPDQQTQAQPGPQQVWSANQLDNLVAPVALYPDPLLGQILVASTYPLEVVEANQWLQRNRNLHGQALVDAAKQQPWDPSVQALVAVPDALAKLNQDVRWTTDLGNAFLAQQSDVMNAVQRMRTRAQDNGRLASTPQQTVTTQNQGGQPAIVIQPADPQVIYVPTYDPYYIWGPPLYGYYPPLYYPYYGFGFGIGFDLGFCFGGWGGWGFWGWGPNWWGHSVYMNNYFFNHYGYYHHDHFGGGYYGKTPWVHDPGHRMNVPYSNTQVAARFGGRSALPGNSFGAGTRTRTMAGVSPPTQRNQNQGRYQYLGQSTPRSTQIQQPQRSMAQAPQQNRSGSRVVPFGGQSQQRYVAPQQSQQYRSAPQASRTFQNQRFQGQAAPQYHFAPQMSSPRFSGGNLSRGGSSNWGGGFSRGGSSNWGGSLSRGGGFGQGGGFSRGSSGGFSRGGGGSFSRGGGGGHGGGGRR